MRDHIKLVLFDIDGTLLITRGAGRESTRLALLEVFGTESTIATHHFGGKTDRYTLLELLGREGFTEAEIEARLPLYEASIARHLSAIIHDYTVDPCPGALDVVAELRRRRLPVIGILTGNVSTTAPIKLRAAGFDPAWFPVGAYGSEAVDRNLLPFLAVERAERLIGGKIDPQEVTIIGDTPADVACARALGAVAVAVGTGFSDLDELRATGPDYFIEDMRLFFTIVMDK
jgi:phosphoglycolate phosphatase-like HAD superfamily hydrolase